MICHKTGYGSKSVALAKIRQIKKNRLVKGKYNKVSTRVYTANYCERGCRMWHIEEVKP